MIWADLADTDVLQFEENQDLRLGTQLVKTYKLTQAINLKESLSQGTGILTMREKQKKSETNREVESHLAGDYNGRQKVINNGFEIFKSDRMGIPLSAKEESVGGNVAERDTQTLR